MTSSRIPTTALLLGMTLEQAREALEHPVEGKCFWLGGTCDKDAEDGGWLCPQHRAWTPDLGDARGVLLRGGDDR